MEKKFLLYCASLMAILIAGDGHSSNLPNPNSLSSFFAQNPNPNSQSSLNLSYSASPVLDVVRLQTSAKKVSGISYNIIPGVVEHVVWKSGKASNVFNKLWNGYFSICKAPKEQLKQVKNLAQVLAPGFMIQAREKDLCKRCVVINVVPAATCAPDDQLLMSQLTLEDKIYMHLGTLFGLPSKLISGSSLEFDVVKCVFVDDEEYFYDPAELRFYSSSENSVSGQNSPQSIRQRLSTFSTRGLSDLFASAIANANTSDSSTIDED
ncbi:hypothetical protein FACS1894122_09700 [Alphaproteobacteria bacterium]|nr:hypothetical protein FACS1894122_09700 [Alphaproteobacteria bacterium]